MDDKRSAYHAITVRYTRYYTRITFLSTLMLVRSRRSRLKSVTPIEIQSNAMQLIADRSALWSLCLSLSLSLSLFLSLSLSLPAIFPASRKHADARVNAACQRAASRVLGRRFLTFVENGIVSLNPLISVLLAATSRKETRLPIYRAVSFVRSSREPREKAGDLARSSYDLSYLNSF